jgi:periplasmic divalent cation tolerance protein
LLIKTLTAKYPELENFILENHSYDTPEVVAIPVERIADKYLGWVASVLEEKP